jgi:hypothetical protein
VDLRAAVSGIMQHMSLLSRLTAVYRATEELGATREELFVVHPLLMCCASITE